jgi:2-C-methyl-D-erythritol 2,4-cyclodiphosphate synthase
VPLIDTVRRRGGGVVDRDDLLAVQTPQAFAAGALRRAHATGDEATDDATLVERSGGRVVVVPGDPTNIKITRPQDLVLAEALLAAGGPDSRVPLAGPAGAEGATGTTRPRPSTDVAPVGGPGPVGSSGAPAALVRLGHGFDVHPFGSDPDRHLVLGGVHFEGHVGLAGHSDADVVAHAVADALLGAAGLGDIGQLFPDTDPAHAGADSLVLLAEAVRRVRRSGWAPGNVDCTVVAESPKLAPRRAEMETRLGAVVGAPVTVKGKRAEGLGALGRREGIACWAVAVLVGSDPS